MLIMVLPPTFLAHVPVNPSVTTSELFRYTYCHGMVTDVQPPENDAGSTTNPVDITLDQPLPPFGVRLMSTSPEFPFTSLTFT